MPYKKGLNMPIPVLQAISNKLGPIIVKRYAETFFRYWFIVLVPLVLLPAAMYVSVRHMPNSYFVSANVQVDQDPPGYSNQYISAAQNEADAMNEFLQSPSNVGSVVAASIAQSNSNSNAVDATALTDSIVKTMQASAHGEHLLNVSYTGPNADLGVRVVQAFLSTVQTQQQSANNAQTQTNLYVLNYQLREAQKQAAQSYKTLHTYMDQRGYSNSDLTAPTISDPQLSSLNQQYQLDAQNASDLQQQISKARAQTVLPPGSSQANVFTIKDYPTWRVVSATRKKVLNIGIAFAVGLLLSLAFLVIKTMLDRSLRYPDEATALFDLPVLAVVPYHGARSSRRGRTPKAAGAVAPRGQLADV